MAMDLRGFNTTTTPSPFTPALLEALIDSHERTAKPRQELLWSYYRNPMLQSRAGAGRYTLAQERGLPARLLGASGRAWGRSLPLPDDRAAGSIPGVARKEIVIENDIAWRIHAMVDFLLGRPVVLASTARDPAKRRLIERVLDAVWESSGGIALLQDLALLANVFGHVDLVVRAQSRDELSAESHANNEREAQDENQGDRALGLAAAADSLIARASRAVRVAQ